MKKFGYLIPLAICCLLIIPIGYLGYHEFKKGLEITKQEHLQAQKEQLQKDLLSYGYNPELAEVMVCPPDSGHASILINTINRNDSVYSSSTKFTFYTADYCEFDYKVYFKALPAFFELKPHTQLALLTNIYKCGFVHFRKEYADTKLKDFIDFSLLKRAHVVVFNKEFINKFNECVHKHFNDYTGFDIETPPGGFNIDSLGYISIVLPDNSSAVSIFRTLVTEVVKDNDDIIHKGDTISVKVLSTFPISM